MPTRNILAGAVLSVSVFLAGHASAFAQAEDYPNKPIRIVNGLGAGSTIDIITRALAEEISKRTGQPFIHENMAGARQVPAVMAVVQAAPDGYTILSITQNAIMLNPLLIKDLSYDPLKDLVPISLITYQQHAITFRGPEGTDWKNWSYADLVEYSKANPEKIFYGSTGIGSGAHLSFEWQMNKTGAKFTHVPYADGTNPPFLAGDIQLFQGSVSEQVKDWYKEGFAKPLAVPDKGGNPLLPGVPSFDEVIAEGYQYLPWTGWFAPAGTPKPIIDKLQGIIAEIMKDKEFVEKRVMATGFLPGGNTSDEFRAQLEKELPSYRELLLLAGVEMAK